MAYNNAPTILALGQSLDTNSDLLTHPTPKNRQLDEPCLPERLPTMAFLSREADDIAPKSFKKEILRVQSLPSERESGEEESLPSIDNGQRERRQSVTSVSSSSSLRSVLRSIWRSPSQSQPPFNVKNAEPYEILRAIEAQDVMFLMQVRDNAFPLLLRNTGGVTPLVHAMRLGKSDVAIVLLGAFSRWVNHLEDDDIHKPQTQTLLKSLRTNLKIAIDEGLAIQQSDLIASFMQTLIMSEGDKWVWSQVSTISRALNAGAEGKPVKLASAAVRRFATRNLGTAGLIASFEDYVANATADLLLLSAWALALQYVQGETIPSHYFARDDRVYKSFIGKLDQYKTEIRQSCGRQLRSQLETLRSRLEGRTITYRKKIELLAIDLDDYDSQA